MNFARIAVLAAFLLGLPDCAGPTFIVQEYPGPVRAADTIAILRLEGNGTVQLLAVDGERADARVAEDARLHVEILPGKHSVMVQNLAAPANPPEAVAFQAEAGKIYRPAFMHTVTGGPRLHVFEIDPRTGMPIGDATLAPPRAPEPAPVSRPEVQAPEDAGTSPEVPTVVPPLQTDGGPASP
jgi:hypothetical protein